MSETKEIQAKLLEIFKVFSSICEQHNLRYIAISATLIGVVRHKGFVPWDEDMDVLMPYSDCLKFLRLAKEHLPKNLEIISNTITGIKLCDNQTAFIPTFNYRYPDNYRGVQLDITRVVGVPKNELKKYARLDRALRSLDYLRQTQFKHLGRHGGRIDKKWLLCVPVKLVLLLFPYDYFTKVKQRLWLKHDFDEAEGAIIANASKIYRKITLTKEDFNDFIYLDFEDTKIRCPKNYDEILTKEYGDYMTPPPHRRTKEQQQAQIRPRFVDLNRSYREYQETGELMPEKQRAKHLKQKRKKQGKGKQ